MLHKKPLISSVKVVFRFPFLHTQKSTLFESVQDSGFPGAPPFMFCVVFLGRKSFQNHRKQADFIVLLSAMGSTFSGHTTFRACTDLQNQVEELFPGTVYLHSPYVILQWNCRDALWPRHIHRCCDIAAVLVSVGTYNACKQSSVDGFGMCTHPIECVHVYR